MPAISKTEPAANEGEAATSHEKRTLILCLVLAAITLALYNPANSHPFVNYDDDRYVTENPHVRQGLTADTFLWALKSIEQANWHPLTWMSHALDCSLFRLNPSGHHFTSVLLHAVNVVLLFLLLMWATNRIGLSLFVALLFAVHPIEVESVVWVAERKNVLCTMFFLLTLLAYGWYARQPGWKRYLVVALGFAAGLASKTMVITLPFVLLLLDYWPLGRDRGSDAAQRSIPQRSWRALAVEKLPLLVLSAASAGITMYAQQAGGAVRGTAQFSFSTRIANAISSYAAYLWKTVWPLHLAPVYPHPGNSFVVWKCFLAGLILIFTTVLIWKFRARRYLTVGWFWFLGTLVPVLGLVQVGDAAMADRYAYIPLIGVFVMIAFGTADWAEARRLTKSAAVAGFILLLPLAFLAHQQIGYWRSNVDLWTHTLAVTDNNFIAEDNLGGALILEGKEEEAFPHFEAAARINPQDPMSHGNLGTYFQTHHQLRQAEEEYGTAIALTSDAGLLAQTYSNLGAAQSANGEDDAARISFDKSMRLNPLLPGSWLGMGLLARRQGKLKEAIDDLTYSIDLRPTAEACFELGQTFAQAGQIEMARGAYRQALRIDPGFSQAQQAADALPSQQK